jgi:OOP family OmpA-OmpF porin
VNNNKLALAALGFAAATAFAGSALAQAQESAWYLGASVGQGKATGSCSDLPTVSCDKTDSTWKLFGGYQFNRYIAAEGAYSDLGKRKTSGPGLSVEVKATAWELVGVGAYPIGSSGFAPYGKLGVYRTKAKVSANVPTTGDDTHDDVTVGLGLRYDATKNISVRAEWQRYNGSGSDLDVLSIGALWKF